MSTRRYRVTDDEDVRRVVASLPAAGKRALAELFREVTRGRAAPRTAGRRSGGEVSYASSHALPVAYRVDHEQRVVQVLSLVWLGDPG